MAPKGGNSGGGGGGAGGTTSAGGVGGTGQEMQVVLEAQEGPQEVAMVVLEAQEYRSSVVGQIPGGGGGGTNGGSESGSEPEGIHYHYLFQLHSSVFYSLSGNLIRSLLPGYVMLLLTMWQR